MRVTQIASVRRRRYVAVWRAVGTNVAFAQEITAAEYGPVREQPLAARVDVEKYRSALPPLPTGASSWRLTHAWGGEIVWDTLSGGLEPGNIGIEDDAFVPQPKVFVKFGNADDEEDSAFLVDAIISDSRDISAISITGLSRLRVQNGEITKA